MEHLAGVMASVSRNVNTEISCTPKVTESKVAKGVGQQINHYLLERCSTCKRQIYIILFLCSPGMKAINFAIINFITQKSYTALFPDLENIKLLGSVCYTDKTSKYCALFVH